MTVADVGRAGGPLALAGGGRLAVGHPVRPPARTCVYRVAAFSLELIGED